MKVTQVAALLNDTVNEDLGLSSVINEDLSNVVDFGREVFDVSEANRDNFCKALITRIGRTIFVNRTYEGNTLGLYRDSFEYGAVLQKITLDSLFESEDNPAWQLEDNASYDQNIFRKPNVSEKFFDVHESFQIPLSLTDDQIKQAFLSADKLNAFVSMLWDGVDKSMTLKLEALATRTVTSFITKTMNSEFPSVSDNNYAGMTGVKAINLLYEYNTQFGLTGADALTKDNCLFSAEFIKFATQRIDLTLSRLTKISTLFNIGSKPRFTPKSKQHVILLSNFKSASDIYLNSGVYNKELTALPKAAEVPYWQGSGTSYALSSVGNVHNTIKVGDSTKEISVSYVLGVAFDHDACGIYQENRKTTAAPYNAEGEFQNYYAKYTCGTFADENESFVVFYVA